MTELRPLVTRPEIERQVRERFTRQVEACEELLEFAWAMLGTRPWQGRPLANEVDKLISSEAARGLKTYRAALDAVLGGYGPQAEMLNRSLFEGMAVAHWVRANPEEATDRFAKHLRHNRGVWNKRLLGRDWIEEPLSDIPDEEEQTILDGLFGTYGERPWCGLTMYALVESIEDQWDDGPPRAELREFFAMAHAYNNQTLHSGAMAFASGVIADTVTEFEVNAGPSLHHVDTGLFGALWSLFQLLSLTADHFEIDARDQLDHLFNRCRASFATIAPDVAHKTGRNDPCPCGSGEKFKRCHGS